MKPILSGRRSSGRFPHIRREVDLERRLPRRARDRLPFLGKRPCATVSVLHNSNTERLERAHIA
ncbi:unnamed protein product, partial [Nesidiocoris tenuis]